MLIPLKPKSGNLPRLKLLMMNPCWANQPKGSCRSWWKQPIIWIKSFWFRYMIKIPLFRKTFRPVTIPIIPLYWNTSPSILVRLTGWKMIIPSLIWMNKNRKAQITILRISPKRSLKIGWKLILKRKRLLPAILPWSVGRATGWLQFRILRHIVNTWSPHPVY